MVYRYLFSRTALRPEHLAINFYFVLAFGAMLAFPDPDPQTVESGSDMRDLK